MITTDVAGAQRLAETVKARRNRLGLTQDGLHTRGGPSMARLRTIESGRPARYQPRTLRSLDTVLDWDIGTSAAIAIGDPSICNYDGDLAALLWESVNQQGTRIRHSSWSGEDIPTTLSDALEPSGGVWDLERMERYIEANRRQFNRDQYLLAKAMLTEWRVDRERQQQDRRERIRSILENQDNGDIIGNI